MDDAARKADVRRLLERGLFYLRCGLRDDAAEVLTQAAALAPDDAEVRAALSRARPPDAAPGRVFEITPKAARDGGARAAAMFAKALAGRDWTAAAAAARTLTRARPGDPRAWGSLATALRHRGDFEAALEALDRADAAGRDGPSVARLRAKTLWEAARFDEAEAAYAALLPELEAAGADYADARMSLGMIRMTRRGPAAGIEDYEWRWRTGEIALPEVPQPYWDGTPQPGRRILFYGEQGFGDTIQFARYVPLVAARCGRVVLPCKPAMKRLMASLAGAPEVCEEMVGRDAFDLYVPAMSCLRLFGAEPDDLPRDVPYLAAAADDVARLRPHVGARQGLRVGIAWTGSPTNANDWKRAVDPVLFDVLAKVPGVVLYSLQKLRDDAPAAYRRVPAGAVDLAPLLNDFADTAAAIQCLDLVVTADTSVAHLAGALGKPVWVMVPTVPDWRWMLNRDDSPWYPTLRLYRQTGFGDWGSVLARVAEDLASLKPQDGGAGKPGKAGGRFTRLLPWRR